MFERITKPIPAKEQEDSIAMCFDPRSKEMHKTNAVMKAWVVVYNTSVKLTENVVNPIIAFITAQVTNSSNP